MTADDRAHLRRYDGGDVDRLLQAITDLYVEVYAEPPYNGGPLFSRERFLERTNRQKENEGFTLVAAFVDDELAGFTFGFPFPAGGWWRGTTTPEPPEEVLQVAKFAVIELVVRKTQRGQGLGRSLMNELLEGRAEPFAMLLSEPNAPARRLYERWGWQRVAGVRPADDAPLLDALLLPLRR